MKKIEFTVCAGIGDNLVIRTFFDSVKHDYDQIRISHNKDVINFWRNGDPAYFKFITEFGNMIFSEPPYIFDQGKYPIMDLNDLAKLIHRSSIVPKKPNLDHILCVGEDLNLGQEYIIITTKIRHMNRNVFYSLSIKLWKIINELSKKYKIVIMGEREVERSKEYSVDENMKNTFCIYEQIISNINKENIIDLTVPALGITVPDIKKIQQDCLIMKHAKCVITMGIGGNLWLSLAVANTTGFRSDSLGIFTTITDMIGGPEFPTAFLTQNWEEFSNKLLSL